MSDSQDGIRDEMPEPSPQLSPVLEAMLPQGGDVHVAIAEPLVLEKTLKRKRTAAEAAAGGDDDEEGSEAAQSKRRKGGKGQLIRSIRTVSKGKAANLYSESPNAEVEENGSNPTPPKHKALLKSKDNDKNDGLEAEPIAKDQVRKGEAELDEARNDVEMVEVDEDAVADGGSYIHDAYVTRIGLINGFRIAQLDERISKLAYTRIYHHDVKGVRQSQEQVRLESLFMTLDTDSGHLKSTVARLRIKFVEPYDDIDEKLGEWGQISLIMRLNLIESMQQVERAGTIQFDDDVDRENGDGDEKHEQRLWKEAKGDAKRLRLSLERSQMLLKDPTSWAKHERGPGKTSKGSKKGRADVDGHDKGKDAATRKPRAKAPPSGNQGTGTTPFTTPVAKTIASWENLQFPPEKEKEIQMLLGLENIEDIDRKRQPDPDVREHYAGEEYRFLYRWMEAKDSEGNTRWADGQPACDQLERAHKHFFTEYPFESGKQSKTRKGRAILRALAANSETNAAVKEKFAKFFSYKTKTAKGAVKEEKKVVKGVEEEDAKESEVMEKSDVVGPQGEDPEHFSDEERIEGDSDGSDEEEDEGEKGSGSNNREED